MADTTITKIRLGTHKALKIQAANEGINMIDLLDLILIPELQRRRQNLKRVK